MTDYKVLQRRHAERYRALVPEHLERLRWSEEQLRQERERGLRTILRTAKDRSPWHSQRLAHMNPDAATEADLRSIPPMTKDQLMDNFDDILTDRRVSLQLAEAHLATLSDDAYLLDEFHVVASGGSSGKRAVFVYGWDAWPLIPLTMLRFRTQRQMADPKMGPAAIRANIAAGKATHMTYAAARTFSGPMNIASIPATLPLPEIVNRLNELQPVILTGYPSMLYALAGEASAGRLHIAPYMIGPNSEPLLPEMRKAMEAAWRCPVMNVYGTSEGVSAGSCGEATGMHLNEDVAIFELIDADGNPASPGVRAAKMYVTNLFNRVQPLIRYELTDEVTLIDAPCSCGCVMRRIDDIEGRSDDVFTYAGGIVVHPLVLRSRLGSERDIVEYQVHQTPTGANVAVRIRAPLDVVALRTLLERDLEQAGLRGPMVTVHIVQTFDRQQTGKLKRFFPM